MVVVVVFGLLGVGKMEVGRVFWVVLEVVR